MIDYDLVVPSRKRAENMPMIQMLLPTATICIDEREAEEYSHFVPKEKLVLHPPFVGFPKVFNWMIEHFKKEAFIQVDDDFLGVQSLVGSTRFITDSQEILAILENALQTIQDLDLTTFTFNRSPNSSITHPEVIPFRPTGQVGNAFGIYGAGRHRGYDPSMIGRADFDRTLTTLLEDRCILNDMRYYFDCGMVYSGKGGNVGIIDGDQFKESSRLLKQKWGKHVSFKPPAFSKNRQVDAMSIRVIRKNKRAHK